MRISKKALTLLVTAIVFSLIGLYFMQEKFIFLPTKLSQEYTYQFTHPFEELFLNTQDGVNLSQISEIINMIKNYIGEQNIDANDDESKSIVDQLKDLIDVLPENLDDLKKNQENNVETDPDDDVDIEEIELDEDGDRIYSENYVRIE